MTSVYKNLYFNPLFVYKLNNATYSTICAAFLVLRTIQQLYLGERHNFPVASNEASNHIYVDNFLITSIEPTISLIENFIKSFKASVFVCECITKVGILRAKYYLSLTSVFKNSLD